MDIEKNNFFLQPSRELAQQTSNQIQSFQKYLDNPRVR
jgi:superfamily II DNA/RNA helicase